MIPLVIALAVLAVTGYGNIDYTSQGGNMTAALLDKNTTSLLIDVSAANSGLLAISIPRAMLDTNSSFLILVDGTMVTPTEQDTSSTRNLIIPFSNGTERITITGTHAAPEFSVGLGMALGFSAFMVTGIMILRRNYNV